MKKDGTKSLVRLQCPLLRTILDILKYWHAMPVVLSILGLCGLIGFSRARWHLHLMLEISEFKMKLLMNPDDAARDTRRIHHAPPQRPPRAGQESEGVGAEHEEGGERVLQHQRARHRGPQAHAQGPLQRPRQQPRLRRRPGTKFNRNRNLA